MDSKASFEVEVFDSGTVLKLLYGEGDEGEVFKPIAYIGEPGEIISAPDEEIKTEEPEKSHESQVKETSNVHLKSEKQFISPSARRIVEEKNLNVTPPTTTSFVCNLFFSVSVFVTRSTNAASTFLLSSTVRN